MVFTVGMTHQANKLAKPAVKERQETRDIENKNAGQVCWTKSQTTHSKPEAKPTIYNV